MKLIIETTELEQAVANYVESMGFSLEGKDVTYTVNDNATCHVEIGNYQDTTQETKPTQKRKSRTKAVEKQETKPEKHTHTKEDNVTSDDVEELIWADDNLEDTDETQDNDELEQSTHTEVKHSGFSVFG